MTAPYQKPGAAELRVFGLLFGVLFVLVFGLAIPLIHAGFDAAWPRWPWIAGGIVMLWALVHPASLHLLHRPWMKFAEIAGWVNTRIIMALLFYLLIMPIGLLMRLFGHDPMQRGFDPQASTYRNERQASDPGHMRHPY